MLDIKFVRENPDAVKENIKKKFQDAKLPLVDEVIEKDAKYRACLKEVEDLKAAGVDDFIHVKVNALEALKGYQEKLGIKID